VTIRLDPGAIGQEQRQVAQLELLLEAGKALTSTFDLDAILARLVDTSMALTGAERGLILLFDTGAETITNFVSRGDWEDDIKYRSYDRVMQGFMGYAVRTRTATSSADISTDSRTSSDAIRFPGTSVVAAPIVLDDVALGVVMTANGPNGPEFSETDVSLAKMLAGHAAVAIKNAALYREILASRDSARRAHEELQQAQTRLVAAQKMEAIGSLAAGVAHEINTPIQFISDNASFIQAATGPLAAMADACTEFLRKAGSHPQFARDVAALGRLWRDIEGDYLLEEIPIAVADTLEGAERVAAIVRAMKDFAHPGSETKGPTDLNRVIRTTAEVSRNEWKYVADMELDLATDLPPVAGHPGLLGQSLLIMLVNSAQALAEQHRSTTEKGHIRVSTRRDGEWVEIRIADDGPGIPPEIVDRIFDPFFTTKEIGKGSGQGLSIARSVIVDKHGGEILVGDDRPGALFVIRLPLDGPSRDKQDDGDHRQGNAG